MHPVHLSVTSIEYNAENLEFRVAFKIFYDDFESIIGSKYGVVLNLGGADELENGPEYFSKYINENFKLRAGESDLFPEFQYKKIVEYSIWLYYIYKCDSPPENIGINNGLMMDLFSDQTNLVLIKIGDFEKGYSLRRGKEKIDIQVRND